jgi:DNA-binding NtrC family response regulator
MMFPEIDRVRGRREKRRADMKRRLLWAEPDEELLGLYQQAFSRWGFDVRWATNGLECMAQLHNDDTDLLVLDCDLVWGGADGVLAFLREQRSPKEMPDVFVIGDPPATVLSQRFSIPAANCLRKPFRLSDVRDRFETCAAAETCSPA